MLAKSKLLGVKIIFPAQGQNVSDDKNLTISGTSTYNSHNNCQVSLIVNNIRPYQHVIATGHNGTNDYSKWKFPLSPKYATLKPGLNNKATAKLTCNDNPANARFYSVNFTSVSTGAPNSQLQQHNTPTNDTAGTTSNKNSTGLLSTMGKQESNKSGNSSASSSTVNYNKMISKQQKTLDNSITSKSSTNAHKNKSSVKSESQKISKDSTVNGTSGPFILSLPSINKNVSSYSLTPELQSMGYLKIQ